MSHSSTVVSWRFLNKWTRLAATCAALVGPAGGAIAAQHDVTWVGPAVGSWNLAANWSGGVVPANAGTISLNATANHTDLGDNSLVLDYTGDSPYATVKSQILAAYHGGLWDGSGISGSLADVTFGLG